ncbi:serine/threonine-protein kinase AtPK2/AtPK19-like isoform X2 [Zootermopsis nevadensis]|uniref:serine/threonine-protein kinase AtPK2/AtPK19-like isoform X2 n=1 Tax=Zootermopsis nevadensis TaxID=136037 RepID=UPI000B8E6231|nr:serine/threonine-protein kinase AtPK2/AtPK19-like isoform X2 [Zootermopsis nevadensis]
MTANSLGNHDCFQRILEQDPEIPEEFSTDAKLFVKGLLTKEPKKRLGAGENGVDDIKRHRFFNNINWAEMAQKADSVGFS